METAVRTLALLYGGRSAEHEVSIRSAASVFEAVDPARYAVIPVFLTKDGAWYVMEPNLSSFRPNPQLKADSRVILSPDPEHRGLLRIGTGAAAGPIPVDVVLPILHGTFGEDGTLQGLLEMANLPYVGCGVASSAVGMDKVLMKGAFRDNGLEVGPFFWFLRSQWYADRPAIVERAKSRPLPLFVKPANLGSSVGISKVSDIEQFEKAVELAAAYDRKIVVEDGIGGRELEVSVLGNEDPKASVAGEIIPHSDFYDYDTKYLTDAAELKIPADLPPDVLARLQEVAVAAFRAVDGSGLSRVDMFLTPKGKAIVNEINTLPGFTSVSMYPKLWEASGLSYSALIDRLVDLAMERHQDRCCVLTDRKRT